jgi:uncharacterized protein
MRPPRKEVMKALLVLVVIYVGAFFIAIQGASQAPVEASSNGRNSATVRIDAGKRADIRSLLDLVGTRDAVRESEARQTEEFRENLVSALPEKQREQRFVNTLVTDYQKKFNAEAVTEQLVAIYDKHFTDDEIKGLLQFYNSPLGRKFAAESPKIAAEIEAANRAEGTRTATLIVQQLPGPGPETATGASLTKPQSVTRARSTQRRGPTQPETLASASQP